MWTDGHLAGWSCEAGTMLFGLLWMTLFIGLPTYFVYWLATRSRTGNQTEDSALALFGERYARLHR